MKPMLSRSFSSLPKVGINKVILCGRVTSLPQNENPIVKPSEKEVHSLNPSMDEFEFLVSVTEPVIDRTSNDSLSLKKELLSYKVIVLDKQNQNYLKTHLTLNSPVYVEGSLDYSQSDGQDEPLIYVSNQHHGNLILFDSATAILTESLKKKRKKP